MTPSETSTAARALGAVKAAATDMEGGFVKWQGEAASTTVAADAASC